MLAAFDNALSTRSSFGCDGTHWRQSGADAEAVDHHRLNDARSLNGVLKQGEGRTTGRERSGAPPNITSAEPDCRAYNVAPMIRARSKYGVTCMGNTPPGMIPNPKPAPQSYLVKDIEKPRFPRLTSSEAFSGAHHPQVRAFRYERIAWLPLNGLIVFDATDGPCEVWAADYAVLNGACNEYDEPGENPYATHPVPGCFPMKRPWMNDL